MTTPEGTPEPVEEPSRVGLDTQHTLVNPSRYMLPHRVSPDRRRARLYTLTFERETYGWAERDKTDGDPSRRALPPSVMLKYPRRFGLLNNREGKLPVGEDFTAPIKAQLLLNKQAMKVNGWAARLRAAGAREERRFQRLYPLMVGPGSIVDRWSDDAEFARQRLCGVNPMRLQACRTVHASPLFDAADAMLKIAGSKRLCAELALTEELFEVRYDELLTPRFQSLVETNAMDRKRAFRVHAPRCIFWVNPSGRLMPLAIEFQPNGEVFTPSSPRWSWQHAKAHVQCADAHVHEGFHHLLETHLVNEALYVALCRTVHPDHPLRQLLTPHFKFTLAINNVARGNLLSRNGPIDLTLAGGVEGVLEATRVAYAGWNFQDRRLDEDLRARGVRDPDKLPGYHYRDDALDVRAVIRVFVESLMRLWYTDDRDVRQDYELKGFLAEVSDPAGADIPGFPTAISTRAELYNLVTELIFRAGPQHAAVNNGQFDTYGYIPNTPGALVETAPLGRSFTEGDYWKALPDSALSLKQLGMVWVLSEPTRHTIMDMGEGPAFDASISEEIPAAFAMFRRRLHAVSMKIRARNKAISVPYPYLDPPNVSRSTDI